MLSSILGTNLTKWELIERIILSKEALIFALIMAIIWLVGRLNRAEKEKKELYQKLLDILTGALINERIKNYLAKNNHPAKIGKKSKGDNPESG